MCLLWACVCNFQVEGIYPCSQKAVVSCFPWCLQYCSISDAVTSHSTCLVLWGPWPGISSVLPFPLALHIRINRNQSLKQPPEKQECWTHSPLFFFPLNKKLRVRSFLFITQCCAREGRVMVSKYNEFSYPLQENSSWLCSYLAYRNHLSHFWSSHKGNLV